MIDAPLQVDLPDEAATIAFAGAVAPHLRAGDLVVLTGPLGAGKTFFTREICRALGLDESEPVTSPTFTLVHEYETVPPLCHADLYRVTSAREVLELGITSLRETGNLLIVEWGAPFVEVLGGDAIEFEFQLFPRSVLLRASSPRTAALVKELSRGQSRREGVRE